MEHLRVGLALLFDDLERWKSGVRVSRFCDASLGMYRSSELVRVFKRVCELLRDQLIFMSFQDVQGILLALFRFLIDLVDFISCYLLVVYEDSSGFITEDHAVTAFLKFACDVTLSCQFVFILLLFDLAFTPGGVRR